MTLEQQIQRDCNDAMIRQDRTKVSVLRMVKSTIKNILIEKHLQELSDEEICRVLQKAVKTRKESIKMFIEGNRPERAEKEQEEIRVIETYLPKPVSMEELILVVDTTIKEIGAKDKKQMGQVIKIVSGKLQGRAGGKEISQVVGEILK